MKKSHDIFINNLRPTTDEEKLSTILNTLNGYEEYTLNAEGIIISSNVESITITGYEEWEIIGQHISILYTEEERVQLKPEQDLEKAAKLKRYISNGFKVKKHGDSFWAKIKFAAIEKEDGTLCGFKITLADSTHRAVYSLKTRRIRDEYFNLFNNSFIGIIKFRIKDNVCLQLNQKASEILGSNREDLLLQNLFYLESDYQKFIKKIHKEKRVANFEFRLNTNEDEIRYCSLSCKLFTFGGFLEGAIIDITKNKQQLVELEQLNRELDSFLYRASHDLRSPLVTILGLTNLIKVESQEAHTQDYASKIEDRINHLDSLLKNLSRVAYNNTHPIAQDSIDPQQVISEILKKHSAEYPQIATSLIIDDNKSIQTDFLRFSTILSHVIANAFRYHQENNPKVTIKCHNNERNFSAVIEDNGKGIDKRYINSIFNLFFKADAGSGSGLGLYIVKSMIDKLQGTIQVNSTPGKGTSVHLVIPKL